MPFSDIDQAAQAKLEKFMDCISGALNAGELRMDELTTRLDKVDSNLSATADAIEANTKLTKEHKEDTSEMLGVFKAAQGAFKVLETLGKLAKPLAVLGAIGTGIITFWHDLRALLHLTP